MNQDALLIVDMQAALLQQKPYNAETVVANICTLAEACRTAGVPVIYVRHDGGPGDELEAGTASWQIYAPLAPLPGEKIFDKCFNSAFRRTGLHEYLQAAGIRRILLCGMQSEHCLDATCKVAFEYGYELTIPEATTTTFDNAFASGKALSEYYEHKIWKGRYAQVLPLAQILASLHNGIFDHHRK